MLITHRTIEIDPLEWPEFQKLAKFDGRNASSYVRWLVRRELAQARKKGSSAAELKSTA